MKLLLLLLMSSSCFAASSVTNDQQDTIQDISIPLAHGELQAEVEAEQMQRDRANAPKTMLELGASTWEPQSLQAPSRGVSELTAFSAGAPYSNLNIVSPLSSSWNLKFGLGFLLSRRFGTLQTAGQNSRQEQTAYLATLRTGIEYAPQILSNKIFRPYLMAALLPTLVMTASSAFDDGIADAGLGFEAGAGGLIYIYKGVDLNIGATETFGSVKESRLQNFAVAAAVRVLL